MLSIKIERFITKRGFIFRAKEIEYIAKANYTLGLFLRKIYVVDTNNIVKYSLKQEKIKERIAYALLRPFSINNDRPAYNLYENNFLIGNTGYLNNDQYSINVNNSKIKLVKSQFDKEFVVYVENSSKTIAQIHKSKFRDYKKNIYLVEIENEILDRGLLLLLVALCDFIFFPEWHLLKISNWEYSFEINFSKPKATKELPKSKENIGS